MGLKSICPEKVRIIGVWPLIEGSLGDLSIPIDVYENYHPGQPADAPGI